MNPDGYSGYCNGFDADSHDIDPNAPVGRRSSPRPAAQTTVTLTFTQDKPWGHTPREVAAKVAELADIIGLHDAAVTIGDFEAHVADAIGVTA